MSVRVRFAPSPTGYLHVGGARTALFNWLFARQNKGVFVLRIEDTDIERSTQESEIGLINDLKWLGLDWDEGPDVGGPYGPYRQSERKHIYQKIAYDLLKKEKAYPCFCPEELLEAKRKEAEASGAPVQYDGTCRKLPPSEVNRRIQNNEPYAIRMKAPNKDIVLSDLFRGTIEWKAETLGDFIILRSNGMPVYNFCVVVDDIEMNITHVLRGDDHLTNTHRQIVLYEALEKPTPIFGHLPMILGPDKTKLSKRHGTTSINQFAKEGYLAEAMINYLALLGWSEGNDKEFYTKDELIQKFSLNRVGSSPAVFDQQKLAWINSLHVRKLPVEKLSQLIKPYLVNILSESQLNDNSFMIKVATLIQNYIHTLNQAPDVIKPILIHQSEIEPEAQNALINLSNKDLFNIFLTELASMKSWTRECIVSALNNTSQKTGLKGKQFYMPLRAKLTGHAHGPDLALIIDLLGYDEVRRRLSA